MTAEHASPKQMNLSSAIGVMVVEDHGLLAQSLRLALTAEGMTVCVPPLDPVEILAMADREKPHVVLLDLELGPLGGDGSALIEPLSLSGARVIVVTGASDRVRLGGCLESGAHGVLSKQAPLDELVGVVRRAALGDEVLRDADRQKLLAELRTTRAARRQEMAPLESLTPREQHVLGALMEGLTAAEIARSAVVSEATVRTQIRGILTKLGVRSQLAAVSLAQRVHWEPRT